MNEKFVGEIYENKEFSGIMLIGGKFVSDLVTFDALIGYREDKFWIIK